MTAENGIKLRERQPFRDFLLTVRNIHCFLPNGNFRRFMRFPQFIFSRGNMKKILPAAALFLLVLPFLSFAEDSEGHDDEPPVIGTYDYKANGGGDQFLKIAIMPNFPLNFGKQMQIGGAAEIGYYRFLNSWLALGGELMAGYNPTLGSNVFTFVPITFGAVFQPVAWRFEFPMTITTGFAFETAQNKKYFPGFALKAEAAAFYRFSDGWSIGLGSDFLYLPEWHTTTKNAKSDYGLFLTAFVAVRYHF